MYRTFWAILAAVALLGLCGVTDRCEAKKKKAVRKMTITSTAFKNGGMIPKKHTCDGPDVSPPLAVGGAPAAAKTIAVICDDPDAPRGTWVHWVLYNLPASVKSVPEHVPAEPTLASGARQGMNDFGSIGYGGPCPPSGTHRYFFKVYALDTELKLEPGATKAQLVKAMTGHILAQGELIGKYSRK